MARYQTILAYDGSGFSGSQRQANFRTVQIVLEQTLRVMGWRGRSVLMAGRTDAGVHATGQVVAFDLDWRHDDQKLLGALNAKLPPDLAVKSLKRVAERFHPRFDAVSRTYLYRLFCEPIRNPLRERYAWRVWPLLNGSALRENAGLFLGTHDFAAFGSPTTPKGTTVRTVTKTEWRSVSEKEWQYEVQADAFLYRMVRRLVFVQVSLAQGKGSVESVRQALHKQTKCFSGLAPAHGLTLIEVNYGSFEMI